MYIYIIYLNLYTISWCPLAHAEAQTRGGGSASSSWSSSIDRVFTHPNRFVVEKHSVSCNVLHAFRKNHILPPPFETHAGRYERATRVFPWRHGDDLTSRHVITWARRGNFSFTEWWIPAGSGCQGLQFCAIIKRRNTEVCLGV